MSKKSEAELLERIEFLEDTVEKLVNVTDGVIEEAYTIPSVLDIMWDFVAHKQGNVKELRENSLHGLNVLHSQIKGIRNGKADASKQTRPPAPKQHEAL